MTRRSRARQRRDAVLAGTAVGLAGLAVWAAPAEAHVPTWTVSCSQVKIDLTQYNTDAHNEVSVTADGKVLLATETFQSEFHTTLDLPKHAQEIPVHLVVKAGDDDQYSRDETKIAPVCATPPPPDMTPPPGTSTPTSPPPRSMTPPPPSTSTASKTPTAPTPTPTSRTPTVPPPTTSASMPPTVSTPVSSPPGGHLAETGSSSALPILASIAGAVVLAGGSILFAVRQRKP